MREQTIFSELTVGLFIVDSIKGETIDFTKIENVKNNHKEIYLKNLKEELKTSEGKKRFNALKETGIAIQQFLQKNKIESNTIKWIGAEKNYDTVSADFQISNFRISIKENSNISKNASPSTIFEYITKGFQGQSGIGEDWFIKTAYKELNDYYILCKKELDIQDEYPSIDSYYQNANRVYKKEFARKVSTLHNKKEQYNEKIVELYKKFCNQVSNQTALIFNKNIETLKQQKQSMQPILKYFFNLDAVPYIIAGTENKKPFAVLLESVNEWQKKYSLIDVCAKPINSGQPEILLNFLFKERNKNEKYEISLKIEIRWSHGKFCGNPEAKIHKKNSYENLPWSINILTPSTKKEELNPEKTIYFCKENKKIILKINNETIDVTDNVLEIFKNNIKDFIV